MTAAQEALSIERRVELVAAMDEAKGVVDGGANAPPLSRQAKRGAGIKTGPDPTGSRSLANAQGVSKDTVRRARKRVEALGTETLERVIGTALDKPGELDALADLTEPEREAIVAKAEAQMKRPPGGNRAACGQPTVVMDQAPRSKSSFRWEASCDARDQSPLASAERK